MKGRFGLVLSGVMLIGGVLAGCSGGSDSPAEPRVISVPSDHATIQQAVDASSPGDMVLIEAGTYAGQVLVEVPDITIRGVDRNTVILDGEHEQANGIEVSAPGVSVENLTTRNFQFNGVIVNGANDNYDISEPEEVLQRFRVSHVTSYNNGLYGIYAFAAGNGVIADSYVSGHPDSGVYVGQCKPCNITVERVTAERNAIGYYGTNASGGVYIIDSTFRANRLGIAPNSQDTELLAPQVETVVAGNLVVGEGSEDAPAISAGFNGGGIAIGGGTSNTVVRNRVEGHASYGIGVIALGPYEPEGNRVAGNVAVDNLFDLLFVPGRSTTAAGNCFEDNEFETSSPADIEALLACSGTDSAVTGLTAPSVPEPPPGVDHRDVDAPPEQSSMDDPQRMPGPLPDHMTPPDLDAIKVPERDGHGS